MNDLDDVTFDGDGRTDRASLHGDVTLAKGQQLTDATDAPRLDTSRASSAPLCIERTCIESCEEGREEADALLIQAMLDEGARSIVIVVDRSFGANPQNSRHHPPKTDSHRASAYNDSRAVAEEIRGQKRTLPY